MSGKIYQLMINMLKDSDEEEFNKVISRKKRSRKNTFHVDMSKTNKDITVSQNVKNAKKHLQVTCC